MLATSDKEANLRRAEHLVTRAAAEGASFVALPELFSWRGPAREEKAAAEALDGPTVRRLGELARRHGITLLGGSILESIPGEERVHNTSVLLGPDGNLLARYRKIHLFDVTLRGARSLQESRTRKPGDEVVVAPSPVATVGMAVCYDLRFPVLFRRLALDGAEIVTLPSAFLEKTGKAHWEVLLRARAIENGVFLIAPDQCGTGADGMRCHGHSMVVDPWGEILAEAGEAEELVLADVDLGRIAELRAQIPTLEHRRLGLEPRLAGR